MVLDISKIQELAARLSENIERVIVGKHEAIELLLVSLLCEGHVLLEDVPGVGKTMLAKSLAKSIDCSFARIQFTPDLLPTDITGVSILGDGGDQTISLGKVYDSFDFLVQ